MRHNVRNKVATNKKALPSAVIWACILSSLFILYKLVICFVEPRYLPIKHVKVVGTLQRVAPVEVKSTINTHLKGFFSTNVLRLKQDILCKIPFLAEANIKRVWPDTLVVTLVEQKLIALWGEHAAVSSMGDIVPLSEAQSSALPRFIGAEEQAHTMVDQYNEISKLLEPAHLKVAQLSLNSRRSLQVELDNGIRLILGRKDISQNLIKLTAILPKLQKRHGDNIESIDFRHTNGICVHVK